MGAAPQMRMRVRGHRRVGASVGVSRRTDFLYGSQHVLSQPVPVMVGLNPFPPTMPERLAESRIVSQPQNRVGQTLRILGCDYNPGASSLD